MVNTLNTPPHIRVPVSADKQTSGATRKFWWRGVAELTATTCLVVFSLEGLFALGGIGEQEYLRPDPIIGACGIPDKTVTYRKEGFGRFRYNSFGMQDVERPLAKPASTTRVCILGDSMIEALQVDRSKNFCSLLEDRLNSSSTATEGKSNKKQFEVLNFGVSMTNLAQMYLRLKHRVVDFHPDIVVIPVRVDAALQLAPNAEGGFLCARPTFFADGKGHFIEDRTVQQLWLKSPEGKRMRATAWLREHSRIWGVISTGVEQAAGWVKEFKNGKIRWGAEVTEKKTAFASGNHAATSPTAVVNTPASTAGKTRGAGPVAPTAEVFEKPVVIDTRYYAGATRFEWKVADPLIREMKKLCDQKGCKMVLLRLPGGNDWRNDVETQLLSESANKYGIELLDATAPFHEQWLQGQQLFYATHFTPISHEILAEQLHQFFQQRGLDR